MAIHRSIVILLLKLFLFMGVDASFAQESLELSQAINYALAQNRKLVRAAHTVDSRGLGIIGAEAEFKYSVRPAVSWDVSEGEDDLGYGLRASKKLIWGTKLSVDGKVSKDQEDDLYRSSIQVEMQQPIFRFGSLIHGEPIVQANHDLKSARRRFEMQKADLVVEVVKTYEDILRLQHQVQSDQESFNRMEALYRVSKVKEVLGRTTRIDTLRVELLRGQALSRLEANQERLSSTKRDFAELLGFEPGTVFELEPAPLLKFEIPEPEEAVKIALENRLDYAQVLQDHEDAVRNVDIARRSLWPDLKLFARYEWFGEGQDTANATQLDENIWVIGIAADTDFNLTKERTTLGQARINQTSALETIKIIELSIARQVVQSLLAYRRTLAEVKIAEKNFELAVARAKLARRLFELGRGDNFSVTDAEEAFLQAENRLFTTRPEALVSGYRLSRSLGTLIESPRGLRPKPLQRNQ